MLETRTTPTTFTVTNLSDPVAPLAGDGSLRQAILAANAAAGPDDIQFAAGLSGPLVLNGTQLPIITDDLTIQGPGANVITIDGNDLSRIFEIVTGSAVITVNISGLALTNGLGTGGTGGGNAGAISLPGNENVTLDGLYIYDCETSGNGGAIRIVSGNLTILNSSFINNRSTTTSSMFTSGGGAIKTANALESLTIRNSTIAGNTTNASGGGLNIDGGNALIENTTITNNTADADNSGSGTGGGISVNGSGALRTLISTIVAGNFVGTASPTPNDTAGTLKDTAMNPNASNLIGRGATGSSLDNGVNGNQVGPTAGTPLDPMLGPLQNNGGPMPTYGLLPGSPALARGSSPAGLQFDQRGTPFQRSFGGAVDVGAFEVQPFDTTTTLVSRPNPSDLGQTVTFSASVAAPLAGVNMVTGTVNFFDGAVVIGSAPLVDGIALFSTAVLTAGTHGITAEFVATADFRTSTSNLVTQVVNSAPPPDRLRLLAVGAGAGALPQVNVYDAATGQLRFAFFAYDLGFRGGVRVAVGDVTGDGNDDIVTGAGPGGGPQVNVYDGTSGQLVRAFFGILPASFSGGIFVAAGDINADGYTDIIVGADTGGGPQVNVFSGLDGSVLHSFNALPASFTGGVRVGAGDIDGDGLTDIITAAGPGALPQVTTYRGTDLTVLSSFFALPLSFSGGVYVSGDDFGNVIAGAGPGGLPQVTVYNGQSAAVRQSFLAYAPASGMETLNGLPTGGVRVGSTTVNGQPRILTGPGLQAPVQVFDGTTLALLDSFFAFDPAFLGGAFVGG